MRDYTKIYIDGHWVSPRGGTTAKGASVSRYPEWAEYKRRSWWLLPRSCRHPPFEASYFYPAV